jgi:hypothetical protein
VLDTWIEREVKPRMKSQAFLIRYADDAVMGFSREEDAQRVLDVLPKRFGRFGLKLHPMKTCVVEFRPPSHKRSSGKKRAFDLLGFTHYWAKSRHGYWVVKRKTSKQRFSRSLHAINQWCKTHRHQKVREQHRTLVTKLCGHYEYYGITGNTNALRCFDYEVKRIWKKWLSRRSQRSYIDWPRFEDMLRRYPLPYPRAVHSTYLTVAKR